MDYIHKGDIRLGVDWYEIEGGDDHYIIIYKIPYYDIELYNVLMVDAHRTPTSSIMDKQEIKDVYNIDVQ